MIYIDMDGVLVDLQRDLTKAQICAQVPAMTADDWANLPNTVAFDWWQQQIAWGTGTYILTACNVMSAYVGKLCWLEQHIPIMLGRVIFVPHGTKHHLVHSVADVLYDDYGSNIRSWVAAGGTGVLCQTATGFPITYNRRV